MMLKQSMKWLTPLLLIHVFFIAIITIISFRLVDKALVDNLWMASLFYESNLAVWWAGFCLILAALLFYRLFSLATDRYDQLMWLVLSMMLFALCLDEVASFHERAHLLFGWAGLGVIGLVGFLLFLFSIIRLYRGNHSFWTPSLILLSLFLFASVAGLEFLEHNFDFSTPFLAGLRMVSEESIELIATTLFFIAAYLEYIRHSQPSYQFSLVPNPLGLKFLKEILMVFLVIQIALILLFNLDYVPSADKTRVRGYLVFLYPMLCYIFCACFYMNASSINQWKKIIYATVFLVISISSLFNLGYVYFTFIDQEVSRKVFIEFNAQVLWLCVPLLILFFGLSIKQGLKFLTVSLLLYGLCYHRAEFRDAFYLFTSVISFYCFSSLQQYYSMKKL